MKNKTTKPKANVRLESQSNMYFEDKYRVNLLWVKRQRKIYTWVKCTENKAFQVAT